MQYTLKYIYFAKEKRDITNEQFIKLEELTNEQCTKKKQSLHNYLK